MRHYFTKDNAIACCETEQGIATLVARGFVECKLGEWRRAWWERDLMRMQELRQVEGARVQALPWKERLRLGI